ncbi:winged helix-turn-helix domain-containing protein [Streptomyces mirabilis]
MVYRIHFTVEDLARTQVAEVSPPLVELSAAVRTLQEPSQSVRYGTWRRQAAAKLLPQSRMVLDLIPADGWTPTFLGAPTAGDPQEVLEQARALPRSEIRKDLASVAEQQRLPSWAHYLADDRDLRRQFFDSLEHVFNRLLSPYWNEISSIALADRGARARQVLTGGVQGLFASLNPRWIRWKPPVLEILRPPSCPEVDVHLQGRGLLLVPQVFGNGLPFLDADTEPQPVLGYPAGTDQHSRKLPLFAAPEQPTTPGGTSSLAPLLGRTRAVVLTAIAEHSGCSTKELAALTGLAPASASEHATILREAGLIRTVRHHNAVLHSPTNLGRALLNTPRKMTGYGLQGDATSHRSVSATERSPGRPAR